ncbi:MAG: lytic transglycosylase domain-containing protein [Actinomycetota bacterium]|jgi:soluble lytic murein transglycosylase|nr:lytic transglycosylase domain-containing protein [Rubrobacter sp.]MBA3789770.1 lytic transglycosylase domain-containing protein [Rubrobacter sp.]MDQ3236577.1 lytic transglycosylase domain-containing protein [Actinomycetota bacterium]MDQ3567500.1 lytic transglycosylase domain-containing protein [Actinomycetota bacterium]
MVVAVVLGVCALVAVPVALRIPDTVERATHPLEYEETIRRVGEEHGVEPTLIAGVVYAESRFGHESESYQGAYGLMQILPSTADFISERSGIQGDYRDPQTNLRMGAWYLSYLDGRYSGDERLVLAAYNSGEGRVDGWLSDEGFDVRRDIPFAETRQYVDDVLEAREDYENLYGRNLDRNSQ